MGRQPFAKRAHPPAFKVEAVRILQERIAAGLTLERVGEELEVSTNLLRQWERQVASAPPGASPEEIFPGRGHALQFRIQTSRPTEAAVPETPAAELARLRRENARLREERDFLKKAAAFFAKESR